ncbi:hypothetical protein Poli38472_012306 [Pythium oligandrum]|uniref:Ankyrin repeat protein n=1 Tax=Pythium oligandrum TaxID=41045 RepID=A0A8K1CR36_PYTOL|nr:hypothetical protein Poli38472_012306 [Pythium oligandrum]|eukprot:TMW67190.1 hypothetical protein Poli38472_012306 [Pythium oligandrum]
MNEKLQRALFQAAMDGDLDTIRWVFTLSNAFEAVARSNTEHREMREAALAQNKSPYHNTFRRLQSTESWYTRYESGFLFKRIIEYEQLHVLEWFLSAEACELLGDTMRGLLHDLAGAVIYLEGDHLDVLELILESHLFTQVLSPMERQYALQEIIELAIPLNRADLIRLLVTYGADVDGLVKRNGALMLCEKYRSLECVERLVESGVFEVQYSILSGSTAFENVQVMLALIKNGADAQGEPNRYSPLHTAAHFHATDFVETLVTHGCVDVNAGAMGGTTPLMLAVRGDRWSNSGLAIASFLVAHGANVSQPSDMGETALHFAVKGWVNKETAAFLIDKDTTLVNRPDENGTTPLLAMIQSFSFSNRDDDLDFLLSRGADPYIRNQRDESAYKKLLADKRGRAYVNSHPHFFPQQEDTSVWGVETPVEDGVVM